MQSLVKIALILAMLSPNIGAAQSSPFGEDFDSEFFVGGVEFIFEWSGLQGMTTGAGILVAGKVEETAQGFYDGFTGELNESSDFSGEEQDLSRMFPPEARATLIWGNAPIDSASPGYGYAYMAVAIGTIAWALFATGPDRVSTIAPLLNVSLVILARIPESPISLTSQLEEVLPAPPAIAREFTLFDAFPRLAVGEP